MNLVKFFWVGFLSSLVLSACSNQNQNFSEISEAADGIIGGKIVPVGDKLQASVVAVYDDNEGQLCTGSLLSNNLVLTAAHCIGTDKDMMYIYFETELNSLDGGTRRKVDKVEISSFHASKQFAPKNTGDIALIHFVGSVPAGYKPANFLSKENFKKMKAGDSVVVAGYGFSDAHNRNSAGTLRTTTLKVEDPEYSMSEVKVNQTEGTGVCHGDSGGPAYVLIRGKYYLWGITSRGLNDPKNECSNYAAFTNALFYNTWLNRMANNMLRSLTDPNIED